MAQKSKKSNSPAVFIRFINRIFEPLIRDNLIMIYIDGALIFSEDVQSGLQRLALVLEYLREFGLSFQLNKRTFLQTEVGFKIRKEEIRPLDHKIEAVKNWTPPSNAKQIQRFLGLTGNFRRFIPSYSTIIRPLSKLLKHDQVFEFTDLQLNSFEHIK